MPQKAAGGWHTVQKVRQFSVSHLRRVTLGAQRTRLGKQWWAALVLYLLLINAFAWIAWMRSPGGRATSMRMDSTIRGELLAVPAGDRGQMWHLLEQMCTHLLTIPVVVFGVGSGNDAAYFSEVRAAVGGVVPYRNGVLVTDYSAVERILQGGHQLTQDLRSAPGCVNYDSLSTQTGRGLRDENLTQFVFEVYVGSVPAVSTEEQPLLPEPASGTL